MKLILIGVFARFSLPWKQSGNTVQITDIGFAHQTEVILFIAINFPQNGVCSGKNSTF